MIRNKTIKFNTDKTDERILWGMLQALPHGEFSEKTKQFWMDEFSKRTRLKGEENRVVRSDECE